MSAIMPNAAHITPWPSSVSVVCVAVIALYGNFLISFLDSNDNLVFASNESWLIVTGRGL